MNINLKLLHSFLLVADHSSFREAAERANRSLPAISMQIKQLESQLGVVLFHRTTRRVELTREGEHLVISVRKSLAEIEAGLMQLKSAVDIQTGQITFGCVPTVASTRLPAILAAFAEAYPGIVITLRELAAKELMEAVRRRDVDFGIGPKTEKMNGFNFQSILEDEYFALVPPNYKTTRKTRITVEELGKLPLLKLSAGSALRGHIDMVLQSRFPDLETKFEMMQVTTLIAMAEVGLGVALLPKISLPKRSTLRALRIVEPEISREIGIISINAHTLSPAATRLVSFVERMLPMDDANAK
ncbi:LysR substrate-binding domain-containing protein [Glaciimonas sp. CA11.2]|uniref:LysR family transcriptional regulator n=1 Tax=unclassified Glaciimonas TaxID=2644401 RepID=UPI002AB412FA|nr:MULTISPECIES: LysR substrate-binding domain-containing protein [unclassified Glaciimonas]MDY7546119.1 LysR substrate-binding domain-containing protein [Glaciimonas sp. CA11.2]MEB0010926.1 LysR substrate-binding domain-containing protein [Glaciimonas sp. Cout2]MEB0081708.1 LysR substrate-binding domain-containing protein [Glaciimonas sp. Gout2]MEB0161815.1 LysR substrate-binding domain-containing protein [Glaciimonas sp. CA11.2]